MTVSVLHVVESYGAGTASALAQYVRATPDLAHHLARRLRPDDDHADDGELASFESVTDLPAGIMPALRAVRSRIRELRPSVVHAHSSWGGAFTRLSGRHEGTLVVYTPHCFATERRDVPTLARSAYWLAERMMSVNTDVYAACSARELALARRLAPGRRHVLVANVAGEPPAAAGGRAAGAGGRTRPLVVTMGRITAQRDPEFFVDAVALLRQRVDVDVAWIGGGAPQTVAVLERHGVEVTGWLPRSMALALAAEADVYVHTARWDGAPMSLVEANALDLPALARSCAATEGLPARWLADSPAALASRLAEVLTEPRARAANRSDWSAYFADHTTDRQREGLLAAYGVPA